MTLILLDRRQVIGAFGAGFAAIAGSAAAAARSALHPGYINAHSGAWDSRRRAALVFGGADQRQVLGDLWQYRAGRWRPISRSGPPPRTFAATAYDARRDRLVVFGGNRVLFGDGNRTDTLLDDHWEWDGRGWHKFPGKCPPARSEACCAYDERRDRLLLFGGWTWRDGQRVRLGDLWEFDGQSWQQSSVAGPGSRSGAAMTYDSKYRRILLGGGNGPRADFWAFDGRDWTRLADFSQARFNPTLAFDRKRGEAVLFGGWTGRERIAATALFDGTAWQTCRGRQPLPRNHSLLVPIGDGSRLLLIGGHNGDDTLNVLGDQWQWDGGWQAVRLIPPIPRVENDH